jgi:hypothetical protein
MLPPRGEEKRGLNLIVAGEHGAGHPHYLGLKFAEGREEVRVEGVAIGEQGEHPMLCLLVALQITVDAPEALVQSYSIGVSNTLLGA